ncbi:MAG: hypothetical protein JHD28_08665, partial [Bacteroidia bacterium]|nr:hypothetical protein [Bacteroidia bacterium]
MPTRKGEFFPHHFAFLKFQILKPHSSYLNSHFIILISQFPFPTQISHASFK